MKNLTWRKATASGGIGNCIEVAIDGDDAVYLRESDQPDTVITTSLVKLAAFIDGAKKGEFDDIAQAATRE